MQTRSKATLARFGVGMLLVFGSSATPARLNAQLAVSISVSFAPPALPVYVQPPCPQPNYMWTPGFWAWDGFGDYYWVPGTWVLAPQPGYLWTPGYWSWSDGGQYVFHDGYWATQVGFYGGVNYGFGYGGGGFAGGEWRGGSFAYNTAAVNVDRTVVRTTYVNTTVINNTTIINNTHTSFNGGPNGVAAIASPQQRVIANQPHLAPTIAQKQHQQVAKQDRANFASVNRGAPVHAAVPHPVANIAELQRTAVSAQAAPGSRFVPDAAVAASHRNDKKPASMRPVQRAQNLGEKTRAEQPASKPIEARTAAHAPAAKAEPRSSTSKHANEQSHEHKPENVRRM